MDNNGVIAVFNLYSHFPEAGDGGKAVGPLEKVADSVVPFAMEPNITLR